MPKKVESITFSGTLIDIAAEKFRSPEESIITVNSDGEILHAVYSLSEAAYDTLLEHGELELLTSASAVNALARATRRKVKRSNRIIKQRQQLLDRIRNPVH